MVRMSGWTLTSDDEEVVVLVMRDGGEVLLGRGSLVLVERGFWLSSFVELVVATTRSVEVSSFKVVVVVVAAAITASFDVAVFCMTSFFEVLDEERTRVSSTLFNPLHPNSFCIARYTFFVKPCVSNTITPARPCCLAYAWSNRSRVSKIRFEALLRREENARRRRTAFKATDSESSYVIKACFSSETRKGVAVHSSK